MKRTLLLLSLLIMVITAVALLGCENADVEKLIAAVEKSISDFESAVNNDSVDQIKNALSPESSFYITGEFDTFLEYFDGFRPVAYSSYTINVSGESADAYASATYSGVPVDGGVWFWFKREIISLSPSYKVYRYYDNGDWNNPIWKKIQDQKDN